MLTRDKAIEALKVDDKIKQVPIQLFKKNTILLYVGRCRQSNIVSAKGEGWVGQKEIFERQFGQIVNFVLDESKIYIQPKVGDIVYNEPFCGQLVPFEIENEMLYFKILKLDEINLIIK